MKALRSKKRKFWIYYMMMEMKLCLDRTTMESNGNSL